MTDIVPVPAMPDVPLYPALGSANFNNEAYAYGSSMRGVSQWQNDVGLACYTNALVSHEWATVAVDVTTTAVAVRDIAVAAKDTAVDSADTAVNAASAAAGHANTATDAAATATAGANTATEQANKAKIIADSFESGPVVSFNTRGGLVTLQSADISGAGGVLAATSTVYDNTSLMSDTLLGQWVAFVTTAGPGADWPGTDMVAWWNVFTFGVSSRATQIAYQVLGTPEQNLSFVRSKHDGAWSRWSPLGKKPVLYITDNTGHMHGGNGERALNAINVWTYGADVPAKSIPANPEIGDECTIVIANGRTDSQLWPVSSGEPIMGLNEAMTIDRTNIAITFVYVGGTYGWRII